MSVKKHTAGQGIVGNANLDTIFQREIFFPVDPATLDIYDHEDLKEQMPSGLHIDLNPNEFLHYLPELEAEIFWLIYRKQKNQKDIAVLLGLSQPTVSYRYRRTLTKLSYLMTLMSLDLKVMIGGMFFLKQYEKDILHDLMLYTNQEMVGKKHGVRQSSVKWIFVKTKRRLEEMERSNPDLWFNHLGLMILLEKNLNSRVLH